MASDAPLAACENDDWSEFSDYQIESVEELTGRKAIPYINNTPKAFPIPIDLKNKNTVETQKNCFLQPETESNTSSRNSSDGSGLENHSCSSSFVEFTEHLSGSLENLVSTFDEKINDCFRNFDEDTTEIAPAQIRTQDELLEDNQLWWTLTGNYGNILPIDWSKTYTRQLHLKALHLEERRPASPFRDESSDEELRAALDPHNIITSQLPSALITTSVHTGDSRSSSDLALNLPSAEEVIREIESMMRDTDDDSEVNSNAGDLATFQDQLKSDYDAGFVSMTDPSHSSQLLSHSSTTTQLQNPTETDSQVFTDSAIASLSSSSVLPWNGVELDAKSSTRPETAISLEDKLSKLSLKDLNELYDELEATIRENSEVLIQELALRDELKYEKETKNQFIGNLLTVQKRIRDFNYTITGATSLANSIGSIKSKMGLRDRLRQVTTGAAKQNSSTPSPTGSPHFRRRGTYLTTIIPYQANSGIPSLDHLQIYNKILRAIIDDSDNVPGLLTDYILKVLCPTNPNPATPTEMI